MINYKGFKALATFAFAVVFAVAPAVVAPQLALADAPELTFADIVGDDVTSDPNGITVTFESDQAGYIIYSGECVSDTIEAVAGANEITFVDLRENVYAEGDCQISVFNDDGEISDPLDVPAFTYDATAPRLALVSVIDTPTEDTTPSVQISLSEDADDILYGGSCDSAATSFAAGTQTLNLRDADTESDFDPGVYDDCTVQVLDEAGNTSDELDIPTFEVIDPTFVSIQQLGTAELPSVAGSQFDDFQDASVRIVTLDVSHDGEIYVDATLGECYLSTNVVEEGINEIAVTLDSLDYTGANACVLEYRVAVGDGDIAQASISSSPLTLTDLPDLNAVADATAPDIEESEATIDESPYGDDNGEVVGFTFTVDEGGLWSIIDGPGAGLCSDDLTGATWVNNIVTPGVNTVILDTTTGGLADGTYGSGTDDCLIQVADGPTSNNTSTVEMPEFTISDGDGPRLEIVKPVLSPVASGGAVTFRFTSNEFIADADIIAANVDLDGDCFDTEENPDWTDLATSVVIEDENAAGNDILVPGLENVYNTFTILAGEIADGTYSNCKVRFTDGEGNKSNTLNIPEFSVGQSGPDLDQVSYSAGTVDNLASVSFESDRSGTFNFTDMAGVLDPASPCTVEGYFADLPLTSGENNVTFDNLDDGATTCYITGYDAQGRQGNTITIGPFTVDEDGDPNLQVVNQVNPATLTFTFSSETGGDITYDGYCSSTTVRAVPGNNTITFNPLPEGLLVDNCEVIVTSNDDDDSLNIAPFTVANDGMQDFVTYPDGSVYRFFNINTGDTHFYTISEETAQFVFDNAQDGGLWPGAFVQEVPTFNAMSWDMDTEMCEGDSQPVYRYLNTRTGDTHFYAITQEEIDALEGPFADTFELERVEFCAYETEVDGSIPVYRWLNTRVGDTHFYTGSEEEREVVDTQFSDKFMYEGVSFYAMPFSN